MTHHPFFQIIKYHILPGAALVLLVVMLSGLYWAERGYRDLLRLEADYQRLEARNQEIRLRNTDLRRKVYRLKHDSRYIEAITRQQLGGIRDNEVVFKVPE